ncbi:pentatricopeptide repeat-containing protein [Tanacetum coccineum]
MRLEIEMTCQNCGKKGHNKAGCTNTKVDKPPKSPRTKGRPKKNRDVESTSLVDEPDVAMNVAGSFVRPRGKSERIVKNKLLKKNPCVGSSKSNVENLE